MATWADPTATWADSTATWGSAGGTTPAAEHRRTNFLIGAWYIDEPEDFQDVVDFAEGRTGDPFYV